MTITYLPTFSECPTNPARCHVPTGAVEINMRRWRELDKPTREFVLRHEEGHYALQTFDEREADAYALGKLALRKPHSLRDYLHSVRTVSRDSGRTHAAERNALRIAADKGSAYARRLLASPMYASADGSGRKPWAFAVAAALMAGVTAIIVMTVKKQAL